MEATENLIKLYLEMRGYLVRTDVKVKVSKNKILEIDIVAVKPKGSGKDLPNKILGEVKGWKLHPKHIKSFIGEEKLKFSRYEYGRFKIINDKEIQKIVLKEMHNVYGKKFEFVIFAGDIIEEYKKDLTKHLKKRKIYFKPHSAIVNFIFENTSKKTYIDNPVIQFIRLKKKIKK